MSALLFVEVDDRLVSRDLLADAFESAARQARGRRDGMAAESAPWT